MSVALELQATEKIEIFDKDYSLFKFKILSW